MPDPRPIRILCVCLGNICRSPTAEAVLAARLPSAIIDSAGTADWHAGNPPHPPAIAAAAARGYDLRDQRARAVTDADAARFDLVLAMDASVLADLRARWARAAAGGGAPKARLALFRAPVGGGDVPDPYFSGDYETALDLIEDAASAWADQLQRSSAIWVNDT
ncbi:MAG: low molecular weight protein-tyrosine-phosphatase [Pseudomonadota bacterium]